ncbi:hypothetical protein BJV78DRAFT_323354 [Lactifluus subvellereus]|nr:hypothetical protein BJV78DRAFT_323354 [Lactifluus subvellereus]
MLKRQRASSPSPLIQPTATELPLPSADSTSEHGAKRRRISGPPLEGPSRGWGPVCAPSEDEDEDDIMNGCTPNPWANRREPSPESAGEYKTANSLLHDLHAEQQHRRLMSPSPHLTPPPTPFSYPDWSPPALQQPVGKHAFVIHPHPNLIQDTPLYEKYHQGVHTNKTRDGLLCDDVSVYERYEETNRFLGSVFLERRRDLSASRGL